MKIDTTYKLDSEFLRYIRRYDGGIHIFQTCDSKGNILSPVRAKNGFITDHGTRLVFNRINELIEVKT